MAFDRRTFIGTTAATGAAAALAGATSTPAAAAAAQPDARRPGPRTYAFTVMGTTDLHGNVFNWDYFTDE
ncbi:hypothetical protein ACFW2T_14400 [Streptomyces sp. NPDC058892]|uniref:hypothetical protein n=1 Tax=unclassified Streptomyces TaxID=2593676 RepID=UPI00367F030C